VTTSRETAGIYEFENGELASELDLFRKTLETQYNWIWNVDLHEQLSKARHAMRLQMGV
jgi:hypothetical protein